MRFSVIIPLYNKAPYIRKALESVLAQTYTDYELIIVDDGSTDGSAEIAEAILQTPASRLSPLTSNLTSDSAPASRLSPLAFRLRLLKQPNQGVSAARNNGVAQSHGDYLAFLDADDWWEPTYLERMAQLINDYPDAGLYACNYIYYKPGKTHVALNIPTGYINYPKAYYESDAMPVWTGAAMIPRHVYEEMGGFPQGIKLGEDFLLWSKIALRYPVAFLNEPLAWYNNDVPATLRATRNLHAPEHHMLFRLELAFGDIFEAKGERLEAKGTMDEVKGDEAMRLLGDKAKGTMDEVKGDEAMRLLGDKAKGTEDEVKGERLEVRGTENGEADIQASTLYTLHSTPTEASTPYTLHSTLSSDSAPASRLSEDWQVLLDKLRVSGLLEYWLDKRYHNLAAIELAKVNWNQQTNSVKRMYKTPIWLLKLKRWVMHVGSLCKQLVIKVIRL